ncbi:ATP-binding protein [Aporhodopirellula aestuarii]|uniref:histidine kinase n=1 Tax=Aporhodopirellula aestuarii TaxID=2950107 RepID=A0ABT0TYN4_9BACT|nr:ATP-binding protein [Aporhodopirellula aestuarii]MCM2369706.1 ATP-binding protein [Aporhodopirellula aestuarii]
MNDELKVLLVEDDPDCRANLAQLLQQDGHLVRVAGSYGEVRDSGMQPDVSLVVLDRQLPDGVAEEILPEMKKLLPQAEFVIVTGYADLDNSIAAMKLGVVDYIVKPIHAGVFRASVARIVRQRRMQNQLCKEHEFASQVLKTAEAVILVLDLEGRIQRFNEYFTQITGWRLEDIGGKDWFATCIPGDERDRIREVFMATAHCVESSGVMNSVMTCTGRQRHIRWSNTTLQAEGGDVSSILAIGVDVTDLIAAQKDALQSQRLAAIGQTVARLAHESRNALQRIQSSVDILQLDIPLESDLREEVDSIYRASNELKETLEEVRQYAAPILLSREAVLLQDVWRRVWGDLAFSRTGRDAELVETLCGCDNLVDVDVMRLEHMFRNLFENALAACPDPVRIHIDCQCDGADWILVEVQDNGPGLSAEQREKLFEPFFTTKTRGTGLGMSIVRRIVEAHGGSIELGDADGGGAKFVIRIAKHDHVRGNVCVLASQAENVSSF